MRAFYRRVFLNSEEDGGVAFVAATVNEVDTGSKGNKSLEADLTLSDCSRQINPTFSVYSENDTINVRQKAQRLRSTINAFVAAVLAACDEIDP